MKLGRLIIIFLFIFNIGSIAIFAEQTALQMKIHFIEVGQGDSILIETPMKKTILIDGGPPEAGKTVSQFLKDHQIEHIDLLISTHPHIDHIGGLRHVIDHIPVTKIIDSGQQHTTKTYRQLQRLIKKKNIPVTTAKQGDEINIDPFLHIRVLNSYEKGNSHNEAALVLHVSYKEKSFLLMSDVEKKQEREMIEQGNLTSDIIKIGHHGSKTSSSLQFLQAVRPDIALITYDVHNDYGHPAKTVINNLLHLDVNIYSTATFGHLTLVTDGFHYLLLPERDPRQNIVTSFK